MQKAILIHLFLFFVIFSIAQSDTENINYKNLTAYLTNDGRFMMENTIPDASPLPLSISKSGLWLGARKPDGMINTNLVTYSNPSYRPGPLDASLFSDDSSGYIWKVEGSDIEEHITDFTDGVIDGIIPESIVSWPAAGNTFYNPTLPVDQILAPFVDQNNNGSYEPELGDHPVIANDLAQIIPSEMIYTIYNGDSELFFTPMDIEIHSTMYTLQCDSDEALSNTVFTRYNIINKGVEALIDFRAALWQDPDLGCFTEDVIGSDIQLNSFTVFNTDTIRPVSSVCTGRQNRIDQLVPIYQTVMLNQKMRSFVTTYNGGVNSPPPSTTGPNQFFSEGVYNVLDGKFKTGEPMTVGDDGYDPNSIDETLYAFNGDPLDTDSWSMINIEDLNYDVQLVMSSGKETLLPNEVFILDLAHVHTKRADFHLPQMILASQDDVMDVQEHYDNAFSQSCAVLAKSKDQDQSEIMVYPNPSSGQVEIRSSHDFDKYSVIDANGAIVHRGDLDASQSKSIFLESKGLYLLMVKNETTGETALARFIVL